MKSGRGDLEFGADDEDDDESAEAPEHVDSQELDEPEATPGSGAAVQPSSTSARSAAVSSEPDDNQAQQYPYYVRQQSVLDERTERIELFLREWVKNNESDYLNDLAEELGTDSVNKTDGREAAFILAHRRPELVAEIMREDGYGEVN